MSETFACRSVVVCDEVREEIGGKHILIGTYSGVILLPFVPFYVPKLTFRFEVKAELSHYDHVECTVLRPNGSIFSHDTRSLHVRFPEFPTAIVFVLLGLSFEQTGDYAVLLAMDSAPKVVGTVTMVTSEIVQERD
jgi:hypothetical protein